MQGCHVRGEGLDGGVVGKNKGMEERLVEEITQGSKVASIGQGDSFGHLDFKGKIALGKLNEKLHFPAIQGPQVPETDVGTLGFCLLVQFCDNEAF